MSAIAPPFALAPQAGAALGPDRGEQLPDVQGVGGEVVGRAEQGGFGDILAGVVSDTARLGQTADSAANDFALGRVDDLHGTMIAAKKAEISLKLVGSVRNKLLESFHDLWRMNV